MPSPAQPRPTGAAHQSADPPRGCCAPALPQRPAPPAAGAEATRGGLRGRGFPAASREAAAAAAASRHRRSRRGQHGGAAEAQEADPGSRASPSFARFAPYPRPQGDPAPPGGLRRVARPSLGGDSPSQPRFCGLAVPVPGGPREPAVRGRVLVSAAAGAAGAPQAPGVRGGSGGGVRRTGAP